MGEHQHTPPDLALTALRPLEYEPTEALLIELMHRHKLVVIGRVDWNGELLVDKCGCLGCCTNVATVVRRCFRAWLRREQRR